MHLDEAGCCVSVVWVLVWVCVGVVLIVVGVLMEQVVDFMFVFVGYVEGEGSEA